MSNEDEPPVDEPSPSENSHLSAGEPVSDDDALFNNLDSEKTGWKEALDSNPGLKVGAIVGVLVLVIGAVILFSGSGKHTPTSLVAGSSSTVKEVPGNSQISDVYRRAVQETNAADVEKALKTGGSALPEPTTAPVGRVPNAQMTVPGEDPLERWRHIQDDRNRLQAAQQHDTQAADNNANAVRDLSQAMSQQMASVLQTLRPAGAKHQLVTDTHFLEAQNQTAANAAANNTAAGSADSQVQKNITIIEPIGAIAYGQLILAANSDVPGPVLVQVAGGPLDGDRMIGSFQKLNNEYLVLTFSSVIIDGVGHSTQAYAIDPSTTLPGVVTDVDHKYFSRIVVPAAAAFLQGIGSAISSSGNTSVSVNGDNVESITNPLTLKQELFAGLSTGAQQASQVVNQDAQQEQVAVSVAAGTPVGILFTQPVTDQTQ